MPKAFSVPLCRFGMPALRAPLVGALVAGVLAALAPGEVRAEQRGVLGHGRLFSNDLIGDGRDRWRSGAYVVSRVTGPRWSGALPATLGEIREIRLRSEVIQPASLTAPAATDRRYVGMLSAGLHTHFALGRAEASLGADLVVTGPQTGVGRFQKAIHKAFDLPVPNVLANQIGNKVHPTVLAEIGLPLRLSDRATLRPFAEAQAGVETFARIGADLVIGDFGKGALMLRDVATGQRYRAVRGEEAGGFSLVLGADMAHVARSAYLPSGGGATLSDSRSRLRLGLHWQGRRSELFYGLTRLGREFDQQPGGQTMGSLRLRLRF